MKATLSTPIDDTLVVNTFIGRSVQNGNSIVGARLGVSGGRSQSCACAAVSARETVFVVDLGPVRDWDFM
jgi:hypothetical protein